GMVVPTHVIERSVEPHGALAKQIRTETGVECVTASIDLSARDAVDRIVDATGVREVGLVVCNAGADPNGSRFLDRDAPVWLELVQRDGVTTMESCHHFGGLMKARGKGGLLLVNSGACYGGGSFLATYAASKAFLLCFGEALWAELRPHGIDVLNLVLGMTDTPAFRALLAEKGLPVPDGIASPVDVARVGLERLPNGPIHNWGQDDDVAGYAPDSAAARRGRIAMVHSLSKHVFGDSWTRAPGG